MSDLFPVIQLSSQLLEKFTTEFLWGPLEAICFASEVTKLKNSDDGNEQVTLIISYGAVYVFRSRSYAKYELIGKYGLIDVERVSYIEPNIVSFTLKDIGSGSDQNTVNTTVQSDNALDIAKMILYLNNVSRFKVNISYDQPKIESTPPHALISPILAIRPKNTLCIRILQLAQKMNQRFPLDQLKLISEWDKKPQATLRLTNQFNCGTAASAVATAVSWDSDVKCLVLDGFAPPQLNEVLQILFMNSKTLARLSLDNYKDSPIEKFDLSSPISSKLVEIAFKSSHPGLLFGVLSGMVDFAGRLKMLTVVRTKLSADDFRQFFDMLIRLPCFMSVANLKIDEGSADNLNIDDLAKFLSLVKLRGLFVSRTSKDAAELATSIFSNTTTIHMLYLNGCKLFKRVTEDQMVIPPCLSYLDLSKLRVSPAALHAFLTALFARPRDNLLTLNLSDLTSSIQTESLVKCFKISNAQPILAEFHFSGNPLLPEDVVSLVEFLRTQNRLYFLGLARCFSITSSSTSSDLNGKEREKVDECLRLVANYVIEAQIEGLDLSSAPAFPLKESMTTFIRSLSAARGKSNLKTLIIEKSQMGDSGLTALKEFVEEDAKIASLNCDGAIPETPTAFKKAYLSFTKIERISPPKFDLAKLKGGQGLIPTGLAAKLPPKTISQRVSEYESLEGTTSTAVQPMDALIGIMNMMTQGITGKGPDVIESQDLITVFHEALVTTPIPLKPTNSSGSDMLFHILSPTSNGSMTIIESLPENSTNMNSY